MLVVRLIFIFFNQDGHVMGCKLVLALVLPSLAEVLKSCHEEETLLLFPGVTCATIRSGQIKYLPWKIM